MENFVSIALFVSFIGGFVSSVYYFSNILTDSRIFSSNFYTTDKEDPNLLYNHRMDLLKIVASIAWTLAAAIGMAVLH